MRFDKTLFLAIVGILMMMLVYPKDFFANQPVDWEYFEDELTSQEWYFYLSDDANMPKGGYVLGFGSKNGLDQPNPIKADAWQLVHISPRPEVMPQTFLDLSDSKSGDVLLRLKRERVGNTTIYVAVDRQGCLVIPKGFDAMRYVSRQTAPAQWYKNYDCQLIFFAVLRGLYEKGVSTEVVDLILGGEPDESRMTYNFVFVCDLCHAVYEAFVLYRSRSDFYGGGGENTFVQSQASQKLLQALKSKKTKERTQAIGQLVTPWVYRAVMDLGMETSMEDEFFERLLLLAKKGDEHFQKQRLKPELAKQWSFEGGCQICKALTDPLR